ncbi:hypothetical protein Barb6_02405 [Bacteroidales bacterium Barb6]|nr:hypothetical protein Barb6_02405 [Bacteroidales bacterium Barb6]
MENSDGFYQIKDTQLKTSINSMKFELSEEAKKDKKKEDEERKVFEKLKEATEDEYAENHTRDKKSDQMLKTIKLYAGVTSLTAPSFENCSSLEAVTLGQGLVSIDNFAFKGCRSLNPATVQSVNAEAFRGWHGLDFFVAAFKQAAYYAVVSGIKGVSAGSIADCEDKEYAYGTEMTLTATPAWEHHLDYHLVKWTNATGDSLSGDSSYTFKITGFETLLGVRNVHSISYNNSTSRYRQSGF